ncbi:MAG: type I DNA topoisomerase [Bacteroidetes bacterium]|nr:MAG: type I DNA topoisomerase [Bacteroidota bacterium]
MQKNLVIVESPAKAKTIEKYLGADFTVKSSFGHVRDLTKGNNAIDVKNNFKPTYIVTDDKKKVIDELKSLVKNVETVWLATDDDREGEAISWHLKEALGLKDNTKRIVFREITKTAIVKAIQNPRTIDVDLVNAQQARRILDRLVGFELSPILWKKIQSGLSAGRVQSVAVRLVVEREREVEKFNPVPTFRVSALFDLENGKQLEAVLARKIELEKDALDFLEKCKSAIFTIKNLEKKPRKKSPSPPFTTSTLQQQASLKLRFSVAQTMTLAQKLYEAGHISYMRTDSVNLSEEAINSAVAEITKSFGQNYVEVRKYKTHSDSAQEAHEAIRPTNFAVRQAGNDDNEKRLYELIWQRAIASQMADALIEKTTATIDISSQTEDLIATGEVIRFEGFLKVYIDVSADESEEDENKGMLPPLNIGQVLNLNQMNAVERFSRPLPRYAEASLVKKLEELGIGRPSTYAPIISTIQQRGYVIKDQREGKERKYKKLTLQNNLIGSKILTEIVGAEKAKLFPTDVAMVVNDFLVKYFETIMDYQFTAKVETQFDQIANGKTQWQKMLSTFYADFHDKVEATQTQVERSEVKSSRVLGIDPKSGKEVIARLGRYGALVQIGITDENSPEKPKFASLQKGQFLETISLSEALELFKLPREIALYENEPMVAAIGRFGAYVRHKGIFYSLGKEHDPISVSETEAVQIIEAKRNLDANKLIKDFTENPDVKILNGRWGAYIAVGTLNVKIPKELRENPAEISLEKCLELAAAMPEGKKKQAEAKTKKQAASKPKAKTTTKKASKPKAEKAESKAKPKATKKK